MRLHYIYCLLGRFENAQIAFTSTLLTCKSTTTHAHFAKESIVLPRKRHEVPIYPYFLDPQSTIMSVIAQTLLDRLNQCWDTIRSVPISYLDFLDEGMSPPANGFAARSNQY
jgi:hypothetical protein